MIGHSEAGKTSFVDRLLGKEFQIQRESTEGIYTHFAESSFNKRDLVSNTWTKAIFEASVLEKDFHESVLANIESRELEELSTEDPILKVVRWLENTTMDGQGYSANDKPCLGPREEVSAECNQTSFIATDPKEIVSYKKPHTEVGFTMDNKGAKRREETFPDDEDTAEHNISKIRSEEYSQPLDNMPIHTKPQNDEKIKDQWSPTQVISSKASSNTMNYQVHPAVEPTMPNSIDNVSETFYLNQEVTSAAFTTMSSAALNRLKHKKETYTTPSDERIPYFVNIWDHGGQNEFIITNQLFLNVEAFILMVMDISLDLNIPLKQSSDAAGKFGIPKTPAQILRYWLNAIHILAMEKTTEPNIALVLTHQDMIKADDTNRYIDSYIEELLECIHGKPYASYIKEENIFVVDNREGTEGDFTHIRNRIFAKIAKQESWGIERPTRWLKLEADILETVKETEKPYLHISSVKDLASDFAMN